MRIIQGIFRYESEMKWTPVHVQREANSYKTWDSNYLIITQYLLPETQRENRD